MNLEYLTYTNDKNKLRKQYRELAKSLHPDKPGGSKEKFQKLQDEFNFLNNGGKPENKATNNKANQNVNNWREEEIFDFFNENKNISIEEARKKYNQLITAIRKSKMHLFSKIIMESLCENIFINIYKTNP